MRTAVLASGSGTILEAILDAGIAVELVLVDRPCRATDIAEGNGITAVRQYRDSFGDDFDRDAYTDSVTDHLRSAKIELVVMAGFGTILGASIYTHFSGRILNTHPALLPAFKGWHAVPQAIEAGVKVTGCTVHVATADVDDGPILAQEAVRVLPGDTVESLHERIKTVERRIYVETIQAILSRGSVLEGQSS